MGKTYFEPTDEMKALLRRSASNDKSIAMPALREIAKAIELPLREGLLFGDITGDIFQPINVEGMVSAEFPLDPIAPGTERDYVAYTIPNAGRIPEKRVEGDYVQVPTYEVGASIDWLLRYAENARWDVVGRMMEVMRAQFTKKKNDDAWHVLVAAGVDRNIVVADADANPAQFTKRLVSLMQTLMRRNGGGNSTSLNRGRLTDLYLSPEGIQDIRNWGIDQVDPFTQREIYLAPGDGLSSVFGVNLHDLDELGEGQEYQLFFTNELGATLPSGDVELIVGLDLAHSDSFVMPVKSPVEIFEDDTVHRQRIAALYGWTSYGLAALDGRRIVLGSC